MQDWVSYWRCSPRDRATVCWRTIYELLYSNNGDARARAQTRNSEAAGAFRTLLRTQSSNLVVGGGVTNLVAQRRTWGVPAISPH